MRVGTKSVLFGVHTFWLHPFLVAIAWWRLYGFPWQPWLWVLFFVHDLGYLGKANMDGIDEGEQHPWLGARILWRLEGIWIWVRKGTISYHHARFLSFRWGNVALYHSRFLAKKYDVRPSKLCMADKLVICMEPWWFYLPRAIASGEIHEYMRLSVKRTTSGEPRYAHVHAGQSISEGMAIKVFGSCGVWYLEVQVYMRKWLAEHKDGREDMWTPNMKAL